MFSMLYSKYEAFSSALTYVNLFVTRKQQCVKNSKLFAIDTCFKETKYQLIL
jgi:hypothetical protein